MTTDRNAPPAAASGAVRCLAIIPESYLLTTRLMRDEYVDDSYGCPPHIPHGHPEHVVFWPVVGADSVEVGGVRHDLTVGGGLWVPAGEAHVVQRMPSSSLAAVHIDPVAWGEPGAEVRGVAVRPALREMLLYLIHAPIPPQQRRRAQRVCLELLTNEGRPEFELVIPQDARIVPIVRALLGDPGDRRSIEEWAWQLSMSSRTISRAFRNTTGMSFNEWRTRVRITRAVELLSDGMPVGVVGRRVGYATIGAFSNAFHRVVGRRPHEFHPVQG
ncbi:helix-turn-helix domain-containing protein [Microbacterium sp. No. 7]|uniref:helix-turn-helix domain-containing protein n=1 Tax=Microbacterium sp. No. 7 TaxID=1714373 RepID=UPI0006D0B904|nr:AraC family transcriptional regulator [Microbacterium sp. No. 7]